MLGTREGRGQQPGWAGAAGAGRGEKDPPESCRGSLALLTHTSISGLPPRTTRSKRPPLYATWRVVAGESGPGKRSLRPFRPQWTALSAAFGNSVTYIEPRDHHQRQGTETFHHRDPPVFTASAASLPRPPPEHH